jgi:tetratricopeptide (TPR) repeat protein
MRIKESILAIAALCSIVFGPSAIVLADDTSSSNATSGADTNTVPPAAFPTSQSPQADTKAGNVQETGQQPTQSPQYQTNSEAGSAPVAQGKSRAGVTSMAGPFTHSRTAGGAAGRSTTYAGTRSGGGATRGGTTNMDPNAVLKEANQRLSSNPDDAMAHCNRGFAYTQLCELDSALSDFNDAIRLEPGMAVAYVGRANCYYEMQKYTQALADCNKALSLAPSLAMAYSVRGNVYSKMEKYQLAIADHQKALALEGGAKTEADFVNRSRDKYMLKDYKGAIADASIAISKNPHDAQAYDNRGLAENELKMYGAAIADYNKALGIIPNKPEFLCHRGISEAEMGRLKEAIADLTHAIELKPRYALAYYDRGIAEMLNKEYEKATKDVQQAIAYDPHYALALYELPLDPVKGGQDKELATPEEYYYRATTRILMIKNETALADLQRYLDMTNWRGDLAMSAVILMYLGNTYNHNAEYAQNVLTAATQKCDTAQWPFPVIRYLKGETSADQLISQANGTDQITDARGYVGINQILQGDRTDAVPNLEWAKHQGNGELVSYSLAVREIEKIQFAHHRDTERQPACPRM